MPPDVLLNLWAGNTYLLIGLAPRAAFSFSRNDVSAISKERFDVTRRLSLLLATLSAFPVAVLAQGPATTPVQPPPSAPANPISASQNKMFTMLSGVVIAAAEKMPEETIRLSRPRRFGVSGN